MYTYICRFPIYVCIYLYVPVRLTLFFLSFASFFYSPMHLRSSIQPPLLRTKPLLGQLISWIQITLAPLSVDHPSLLSSMCTPGLCLKLTWFLPLCTRHTPITHISLPLSNVYSLCTSPSSHSPHHIFLLPLLVHSFPHLSYKVNLKVNTRTSPQPLCKFPHISFPMHLSPSPHFCFFKVYIPICDVLPYPHISTIFFFFAFQPLFLCNVIYSSDLSPDSF